MYEVGFFLTIFYSLCLFAYLCKQAGINPTQEREVDSPETKEEKANHNTTS